MSKSHLKRLIAPKTWLLLRKQFKFITKANAGPHSTRFSLPVSFVLKQIGFASSTKEAKIILNTKSVLVNGRRVKDFRFPVGLMDVIVLSDVKGFYRIVLDDKGRLRVLPVKESDAGIKLCRVNNKTVVSKGRLQVNFNDGSNLFSDSKEISTGDTVVMDLKSKSIKDILKMCKGALVLLVGGRHMGSFGTIQDVKDNVVVVKCNNMVFNTEKRFVFAVGKDKEVVQLR